MCECAGQGTFCCVCVPGRGERGTCNRRIWPPHHVFSGNLHALQKNNEIYVPLSIGILKDAKEVRGRFEGLCRRT